MSFDVGRGEVVALVGESGSGKTTISRCVGGLHKEWTGTIRFDGTDLGRGARKRSATERKRVQYIFQNPYLSLNPRLSVEQIVKRPMELFGIASGRAATDRVVELLDQVALGPAVLRYQASRLSGGERQRVAIARALAAEPDLLVCDEITSALDVSVQGSIVALLESLRVSRGISMLFVTHNLALVRSIADRVQILNDGRVVESGSVVEVMGLAPRGVHPTPARQQSAHRLMPAPEDRPDEPGPPGLGSLRFVDPHLSPGVPGGGAEHAPHPAPPRPGGPGRPGHRGARGGPLARPRGVGGRDAHDLAAGARRDRRHGRPRVVRRRRHPLLAPPRRLDDQVGPRPPRRSGRPGGSSALHDPVTGTCPSWPAPAGTAARSRTCWR